MKNKHIPTHSIPEEFQGETIFLISIDENSLIPDVDHDHKFIDYAHRDDYYLFFFMKKGEAKMLIDFKEQTIGENMILCISPGQVHSSVSYSNFCGYFLAVDAMFVKDEYKTVFEKLSFLDIKPTLSGESINELEQSISLIDRRFKADRQPLEQSILHDLISSYIGMVAEIYQKEFPAIKNNRYMTITSQFKSLLTANHQTMKRPSQYASELKISAAYLNEAVKKTTGYSVQDNILNEIVIHAKRLLFYTDLSIKEIALNLGYEDWAYFTRLFTKTAQQSPSQFRKKHLR